MSHVITHRPSSDAAQIPTVVLYDVMREAANRLRGELVHLEREHPELLPPYRSLYPGSSARAPKAYRMQLAARGKPLIRRYGLERPVRREVVPALARAAASGPTPEAAPTLF